MSIDERPQLLQRGVGESCTCGIAISGDQSRDGRPSRRVVHQHDPLPAGARSPEHVAHFEPHAVARARGLGDEDSALRHPLDVASKPLALGELRLGVVDIVGQEMRRENVMTMMLKAFADGTPGQHAAGRDGGLRQRTSLVRSFWTGCVPMSPTTGRYGAGASSCCVWRSVVSPAQTENDRARSHAPSPNCDQHATSGRSDARLHRPALVIRRGGSRVPFVQRAR